MEKEADSETVSDDRDLRVTREGKPASSLGLLDPRVELWGWQGGVSFRVSWLLLPRTIPVPGYLEKTFGQGQNILFYFQIMYIRGTALHT